MKRNLLQKDLSQAQSFINSAVARVMELEDDFNAVLAERDRYKVELKQLMAELDLERKLREKDRKSLTAVLAGEKSAERMTKSEKRAQSGKGDAIAIPFTGSKLTLLEKILLCLFQVEEPLTRNQICFYTGMSPTSGPMCSAYAEGLSRGLLVQEKRAGAFAISEAGVEHLAELNAAPPPLPPGSKVFETFLEREGGMVEVLGRAMYKIAKTHSFSTPQPRADIARAATAMTGRPVSSTSGPACSAFARLTKLGVIQGRSGHLFTPWVVALLEPITIGVRDTRTGAESRVTVKP